MITCKEIQSALDLLQDNEIVLTISPDGNTAYVGTPERVYFRYVTEKEFFEFVKSIMPPTH